MQWTIENMWAFHIRPDGTPFSNSYQMEYRPVEYEMPHIFNCPLHMWTLTIVFQTLNMRKDM